MDGTRLHSVIKYVTQNKKISNEYEKLASNMCSQSNKYHPITRWLSVTQGAIIATSFALEDKRNLGEETFLFSLCLIFFICFAVSVSVSVSVSVMEQVSNILLVQIWPLQFLQRRSKWAGIQRSTLGPTQGFGKPSRLEHVRSRANLLLCHFQL